MGSVSRNVVVVCLGGALGIFFAKYVPLSSAIVLLIFLAVYDVIAVYKGPVGKIANSSGLDMLQGLSFTFKDIQMGLGDLVFYSMMMGVMVFSFPQSILPTVTAVVGILARLNYNLFCIRKERHIPRVTFPNHVGTRRGVINCVAFGLAFSNLWVAFLINYVLLS